jgi:YidC/Oxa1 family membrane protein insertase
MDQRNLVLAIVLSLIIILGFQFFFAPPPVPIDESAQGEIAETPRPDGIDVPSPPGGERAPDGEEALAVARAEVLETTPRVPIASPTLSGSISLIGGRIDDIALIQYRETLDPKSPNIVLLRPPGAPRPYYADYGWTTTDSNVALPDSKTRWESTDRSLGPGKPVTLTWDNGQGLIFRRTFALDENFMFTVTQQVKNNGDRPVELSPYGLISRTGTPDILGFYILHEGLIGVFDEQLKEVDYDDLKSDRKDERVQKQSTTGGWIGVSDKYWLVALVPDQKIPVDTRFVYSERNGQDKYQTDYLYPPMKIAAGAQTTVTNRLFAGAKKFLPLKAYEDELGIERLIWAIDWGWFWFLTIPLFYGLVWLAEWSGNFGVAILLLTVGVKIVFFPLANKSYASMAKMKKLGPKLTELRERFGDDKQRLNQEMMGLYKKEGANPMAGCLPILLQIPVFFALYKVMFVTIEMRHAPFFGWIHDLSAQDPTSILNLFGLMPWGVPELGTLNILNLGIWPILMGVSMFLQQRLNPQPTDPTQAKIFLFMPFVFTFLLAQFPAGLVIYWTWNNALSILQQAIIMKRLGIPLGREPAKKE